MEGEALVAAEPLAHLGMLVGGVVVENDVYEFSGRDFGVDGVEEADELLMPMTLHVAADHRAVENIEGGEQRRRAVPLVVMGHRSGASLLHGEARLGAVEGLDLALLVDGQNDGVSRRVDIETDHIAQFVDKPGIGGELELLDLVRPKTMGAPDALDRANADARRLRHHGAGPVCGLAGRVGKCERHNALGHIGAQPGDARRPRLVTEQAIEAFLHEALLPAPDARLGLASSAHDLVRAKPLGGEEHDLGPPHMLLGRIAIPRQRLQAAAISACDCDGNSCAHAPESHAPKRSGIPFRIQLSDLIH